MERNNKGREQNLSSQEFKKAIQKLSPLQKHILTFLLWVTEYLKVSEDEYVPWEPGNWTRMHEEEWTPSNRATHSRTLRRLAQRGLIIQDGSTNVKLTPLGQIVAKQLRAEQEKYTDIMTRTQVKEPVPKPWKIKAAVRKLSSRQMWLLALLLDLTETLSKESGHKFYRVWGLPWHPGKWHRWTLEWGHREWTLSDRAAFSRTLRRLEKRGLVIRDNHIEAFRSGRRHASIEEAAPMRTTIVRLTTLGRMVAKQLPSTRRSDYHLPEG
jgi:DNA-binding MarR family transcriptional regulator